MHGAAAASWSLPHRRVRQLRAPSGGAAARAGGPGLPGTAGRGEGIGGRGAELPAQVCVSGRPRGSIRLTVGSGARRGSGCWNFGALFRYEHGCRRAGRAVAGLRERLAGHYDERLPPKVAGAAVAGAVGGLLRGGMDRRASIGEAVPSRLTLLIKVIRIQGCRGSDMKAEQLLFDNRRWNHGCARRTR